jgi:hypothetical protein
MLCSLSQEELVSVLMLMVGMSFSAKSSSSGSSSPSVGRKSEGGIIEVRQRKGTRERDYRSETLKG